MVGLLPVVGGALVGGLWTYSFFRHRAHSASRKPKRTQSARKRKTPPTHTPHCQETSGIRVIATGMDSQPKDEPVLAQNGQPAGSFASSRPKQIESPMQAGDTTEALQHGMRISSVSFGLATAGLLFFPPLQYATIPTLIYMGVPAAQEAYAKLRKERCVSTALAETATLAICLAGGYYWVGSLGFFLYYWGRSQIVLQSADQEVSRGSLQNVQMVHLLQGGKSLRVLAETLKPGDRVVIETSELAPAEGIIIDGTALVLPSLWMIHGAGQLKQAGDKVCAADLILVGRISIQISRID